MEKPSIGDQELEILQYVSDNAPITVREVVTNYGETHGLARTTILTVMERLRQKGYLEREKAEGGVYQYSSSVEKPALLRSLLRRFTEKVLGGSTEPLVAYLTQEAELSEKELEELRKLVDSLSQKEDKKQ
jgi:predicted transcriptional regulator